MVIRKKEKKDAVQFSKMLKQLDEETENMMYEPGERQVAEEDVIKTIKRRSDTNSLTLIAEEDHVIVGFLSTDRGFANRIKHSAYVVTGILRDYRGKGIGHQLFEQLDSWALTNDIKRLELTVMTHNEPAIKLYKKMGFKIEGVKECSMKVNGNYIDEYYMAKIY
jgi:RimJ/RimL family protein N-acetyltransferase